MLERLFASVLVLFFLFGCAQPKVQPRVSNPNIEDKEWELVSYGESKTAVQKNATLLLIDGRYSGNAGCNSIGGEYALYEDKITFEAGVSTRVACPEMELEMKFLNLLQKSDHFKVNGNQLILIDEGKNVLNFVER